MSYMIIFFLIYILCVYIRLKECILKDVFLYLKERSGNNSYTHNALTLKYKLDNEFELVFVVSNRI